MAGKAIWHGHPISVESDATFYDAVDYRDDIFKVNDIIQIEKDADEPPPIARVIALYEREGKKFMTLEWFYRPKDALNLVQEHRDEINQAKKKLKAGGPPPARLREEPTEATLNRLYELVQQHEAREIFASNHSQEVKVQKIEKHAPMAESPDDVLPKGWFCRQWLDVFGLVMRPLKKMPRKGEFLLAPPSKKMRLMQSGPQKARPRSDGVGRAAGDPTVIIETGLGPIQGGRLISLQSEYVALRTEAVAKVLRNNSSGHSAAHLALKEKLKDFESLSNQALVALDLISKDHQNLATRRLQVVESMVQKKRKLDSDSGKR